MPFNHTVRQGDSVVSLSEAYGLFAVTIWNDPANADLRQKRSDMNVLMPGDLVVIPDKRPRLEKRPTGETHRFRRKGIPALFRFQIFDKHIPRANQPYTLTVDGAEQKGTTDGLGILEEYIPAQAREGSLVIGDDKFQLNFRFGHLDPIDELSGIQKRLNNLGFDCGTEDGTLNDATTDALLAFQRASRLPLTGEADAATKKKLEEIHDVPYQYPESPDGGAA